MLSTLPQLQAAVGAANTGNCQKGEGDQAGNGAYFPPQFCQPSAGCQRGSTNHPGATRAFRYQNDHDLHAHGEEPDEEGDGQPARFLTRLRATAPPVPVGSREWKVRSVVDGVNSYGRNNTSTSSGQGIQWRDTMGSVQFFMFFSLRSAAAAWHSDGAPWLHPKTSDQLSSPFYRLRITDEQRSYFKIERSHLPLHHSASAIADRAWRD